MRVETAPEITKTTVRSRRTMTPRTVRTPRILEAAPTPIKRIRKPRIKSVEFIVPTSIPVPHIETPAVLEKKKDPIVIPTNEWTDSELQHIAQVVELRKTGLLQPDGTNPNDTQIKRMSEEMFKQLQVAVVAEEKKRTPPSFLTKPIPEPAPLSERKGTWFNWIRRLFS